jgi:branched-chain amino acid transport system permease protein
MDIKRNYYEDIQFLNSGTKKFWFAALIIALLIVPFVVPSNKLNHINYMVINVLVAVGLNILVGFTGQVSLGHAGFFAIGSYATILIMNTCGYMPFLGALVMAGVLAALFGFLLGLPSLRLEGPYLAIATLGFGMAITQIIARFPVLGGRQGLQAPEVNFLYRQLIDYGGFPPTSARAIDLYIIIASITSVLVIAARNIIRTRVGRAFISIRDDDIAASSMGVNITYYKTLAFAVSAFYAGVAGGLYAIWLERVSPDSFDFIVSVLFLAMVLVGGVGSIMGSILGGSVISFLYLNLKQHAIVEIPLLGSLLVYITDNWMDINGIASVSYIIFGLIMILIVIIEPLGLFGIWIRIKKYWKTWPF